jgi:ElaB/YqjD/DUF883 family membrane-anchored ribosome-binding protein
MNADTRPSEHASDTTKASAGSHKSEDARSESQFLADEATAARQAIEDTLARMRETLKDGADIRAWTERYPWATVGASAAAGFLVATALLPKRRSAPETEPALLERILADEQIAERIKQISSEEEARPRRGGSMLQSVGATLLKTFGPALQSAVASALAARAAAPDPEEVAAAAEEGAARGEAEQAGYEPQE